MGCALDDGKGLTVGLVCFGRQRSGTGKDENLVFCIIGFYVLSGFRKKKIRIFVFFF